MKNIIIRCGKEQEKRKLIKAIKKAIYTSEKEIEEEQIESMEKIEIQKRKRIIKDHLDAQKKMK